MISSATRRIYSGNFCQPSSRTSLSGLIYSPRWVINADPAHEDNNNAHFLVCPVVRDNIRSREGAGEIWITGYRLGRSDRSDFWCQFFATDHHGRPIDSEKAEFPRVEGRTVIRLDGIDTSRENAGHFSISCRLPHDTAIVEYEVDEF